MALYVKVFVLLSAVVLLTSCSASGIRPMPDKSSSIMKSLKPTPSASSTSTVPGYLLNPAVTQSTIRNTICRSGWTATIRPPVSFTEPLKLKQIKDLKLPDQKASDYEEDHFIPLELGGAPREPRNLRPELWVSARVKDQAELAGKEAVCSGKETLAAAQLSMYNNWRNR